MAGQAGPYDLLEELGRGGMGVVHRARDRTSGREVALKLIARTVVDPTARARLAREAQLTATLRHPGVVRIHATGEVDGRPFLAYELVEGARPLDVAWRGLDRAGRARLLVQVAEALGHAHAAGVVHRDVKPSNVLVDAAGRARVVDFGLAVALDVERLTRTGEVLGTPSFMAPEQLEGLRDVGPPADVWALGVLLYLALTDRLPYPPQGSFLQAAARVLVGKPPPPPRALDPTVPPALDAVCARALARTPGARFPDGQAFAAALEAALAGRAPPGRGRGQAAALVGLAAAAVVAVVAVAARRPPAPDDPGGVTPATSPAPPGPPAPDAGPALRAAADAAAAAAARLDVEGAIAALRAVAAAGPGPARDVAPDVARVVSAALAAPDEDGARTLLLRVRRALPDLPLPGSAAPCHARALRAAAEERDDDLVAALDDAWRLEPDVPVPAALAEPLWRLANTRFGVGTELSADAYRVLLHTLRAGRVDVSQFQAERLLGATVVDAWTARHPDDWAGQLAAARVRVYGLEVAVVTGQDGARVARARAAALEALERLLARADLPAAVRRRAEVLHVEALRGQPGRLLPEVERLLARGHPEPWALLRFAALELEADGATHRDLCRRALAALQARAAVVDGPERADRFRDLESVGRSAVRVPLGTGRVADARAWLDDLERLEVGGQRLPPAYLAALRASVCVGEGRWTEAAAAAREALAGRVEQNLMRQVLADCAEHLAGPRPR